MKKLLKLLTIAIMTAICVAALAACNGGDTNLDGKYVMTENDMTFTPALPMSEYSITFKTDGTATFIYVMPSTVLGSEPYNIATKTTSNVTYSVKDGKITFKEDNALLGFVDATINGSVITVKFSGAQSGSSEVRVLYTAKYTKQSASEGGPTNEVPSEEVTGIYQMTKITPVSGMTFQTAPVLNQFSLEFGEGGKVGSSGTFKLVIPKITGMAGTALIWSKQTIEGNYTRTGNTLVFASTGGALYGMYTTTVNGDIITIVDSHTEGEFFTAEFTFIDEE